MDKDRDILVHIIEHIEDIFKAEKRFGSDQSIFSSDKDYFNSVCMSLLQIGELAHHFTTEFTKAHPEIPWRNIIGLRNVVVHGYGSLDENKVWLTMVNDIPDLCQKCKAILDTLSK